MAGADSAALAPPPPPAVPGRGDSTQLGDSPLPVRAPLLPRRRDEKRSRDELFVPSAGKIGSIGVHVSRGVTTHGMAVNVCNDLQPFEWIVPCGIEGCRVTSVSRELGSERSVSDFADSLVARFGEEFRREPVEAGPNSLVAA